jgi:DNA-binding response OmpR family regulator
MSDMTERSLLIVDDDRSILTALRMVLEGDYFVNTVERGLDALSRLHEKIPDLILLDISLPDMNGIDLLDQIRSLAPETAVIMMTASEETQTVSRALELGALGYLVKPMDAKTLKATLQNAVQKKKSNQFTIGSSR